MICGIIDMGANSIRLSIYRVEENEAKLLLNKKETAGLASYVKNKKLSLKGVEKASSVLNDFREVLDNLNIAQYFEVRTILANKYSIREGYVMNRIIGRE